MRSAAAALLCCSLLLPAARPARADAYHGQPKLVIELVIDQFRGDFLQRYADDFKTPRGFNLFLRQGAYFTDCYYDYDNTMTAPGHSTIGTGAYTNGHNISLNEWWDLARSTTHPVSSVEDEDFQIVGDHTPEDIGTSPRNELASTLADEVVLASRGQSHTFGISLKDRAAILTSGHATDGAFWLDHASGHFVSSTYWYKQLPAWVEAFNHSGRTEQALTEAHATPGHFYDEVGANPASVSYLLDFAKSLIAAEQLGHHTTTDVLTISISSTDILGHRVGPDAPEQEQMIDSIDTGLNDFANWVDHHVDGGLGNVWISLTGDHGIGPTLPAADSERMQSGQYSLKDILDTVNYGLNAHFSPGESNKYVLPSELPYITLDPRPFVEHQVSEADAENFAAQLLPEAFAASVDRQTKLTGSRKPTRAALRHTYTRLEMAASQVPPTEEGRRVVHSYSTNGGWYVMVAPGMYEQYGATGTGHYTPYSYDRHVPLAFFGSAFVPGFYHGLVQPVDIAATFASLLGVNRPTAAVGRVLTEAIRPGVDTPSASPGAQHEAGSAAAKRRPSR